MSVVNADVVIVGAGPSGVAAGIELVRGGANVILVDRESFPRQKPCAGGVSESALRHLKYDISSVVREEARDFQLSLSHKDDIVVRSNKILISMTKRIELDELGLNVAIQEGCEFMVQQNILGLDQDRNGVTLRYPNIAIRAKYLVAADGAASTIRRFVLGYNRPSVQAIALEANIDANSVKIPPKIRTRGDFGVVKSGYAWVFPKGDHYNIGLYSYNSRLSSDVKRKYLKDYARTVLGTDEIEDVQGFPIGTDCRKRCISKDRVLFVGDAGGFTHSITGEGIYGAALSGHLAAKAVLGGESVAQTYQQSISPYLRRCRMNRALSQPFYRFIPLSYPLFSQRMSKLVEKFNA